MKRLNITIDLQTYENVRLAAFLSRRNISDIIREALVSGSASTRRWPKKRPDS